MGGVFPKNKEKYELSKNICNSTYFLFLSEIFRQFLACYYIYLIKDANQTSCTVLNPENTARKKRSIKI